MKEKFILFLKAYSITITLTFLAGRFLGFTPKQLNPIPWMELFKSKLGFILIFSGILSLLFVLFKGNSKK